RATRPPRTARPRPTRIGPPSLLRGARRRPARRRWPRSRARARASRRAPRLPGRAPRAVPGAPRPSCLPAHRQTSDEDRRGRAPDGHDLSAPRAPAERPVRNHRAADVLDVLQGREDLAREEARPDLVRDAAPAHAPRPRKGETKLAARELDGAPGQILDPEAGAQTPRHLVVARVPGRDDEVGAARQRRIPGPRAAAVAPP